MLFLFFPMGLFVPVFESTEISPWYWVAYWLPILGFHAAFIRSRYWIFFVVPFVVFAITLHGCITHPIRIGP